MGASFWKLTFADLVEATHAAREARTKECLEHADVWAMAEFVDLVRCGAHSGHKELESACVARLTEVVQATFRDPAWVEQFQRSDILDKLYRKVLKAQESRLSDVKRFVANG